MKTALAGILSIGVGIMGGCQAVHTDAKAPADEPSPMEVNIREVPMGELGHPIGELLLIEGTRFDVPSKGNRTLRIDKVNGQLLALPAWIWVNNVDLPQGERCMFRGYETIQMTGDPPAYAQLAKLKGEPPPVEPQAPVWQIDSYFVALDVVQPKTLKLNPPPSP